MTATYVIAFKAKRLAWLPRWMPFNSAALCFEKRTTWANAYSMATQAAQEGAWDVRVGEK